ncbi:MAG: hypothetical protein CVV41_01420 [Candidatus Riflebacteria bacterium HGW-Riflebacteria-1]|jgi:hypothetical protein|nr:MAG: hypothetical protein CVV41_01420 [Candidatus Riflebacteria bacterium HGW-Riflebacteria-1]
MKEKMLATILAMALISAGNTQTIATEQEIASGSSMQTVEATIEDTKELPAMPVLEETQNMKYIIKKLSVPHCKRGPERCEMCLKTAEPHWCLLDIDPPEKETMQRPVIEVEIDGERLFLVYDVIKRFASEEEARQFLTTTDLSPIKWAD